MENCLFKQSGRASSLHVDCLESVESVHHIWRHWASARTHLFTCGDLLGQIAFKSEGTRLWYRPKTDYSNCYDESERERQHHMEIFYSTYFPCPEHEAHLWTPEVDQSQLVPWSHVMTPHKPSQYQLSQTISKLATWVSEWVRRWDVDSDPSVYKLSQNSTSTTILSKKLLKLENNV